MLRPRRFLLPCLTTMSLLVALFVQAAVPTVSQAGGNPTSVTIAGDLQTALGCQNNWDPSCASTHLTYDANDDVWQSPGPPTGSYWALPAGSYQYKAALNDNWNESYGRNGNNILLPLTGGSAIPVKFYYDNKTHWVTDNHSSIIVTAPGDYQTQLGCSGNWDPGCLRSWLEDPNGNGTYSFQTSALHTGSYQVKATINESWDENYGAGGAPGGANISFTVPYTGAKVTFRYTPATHLLSVSAGHTHDNNVEYNGLGHNSQDTLYRTPFGAVTPGTPVTLRFRTYAGDVTGVRVRFYDTATGKQFFQNMIPAATTVSCYDSSQPDERCDFWQTTVTPTHLSTLYYRFIVTDGTATAYYADTSFQNGSWGQATSSPVDNSYAITVYSPGFQPIPWLQNAVIYQVFPDRFRNGTASNDPSTSEFRYSYPPNPQDQIVRKAWTDLPEGYCRGYQNPSPPCTENAYGRDYFGGDLLGLRMKLPYLQSLGVNALYLNPIFESGSNHGYDTRDYLSINHLFGNLGDFIALTSEAHARGMKIILDGVFNHVSSDSPYFDRYHHYPTVGACESLDSPYRSWFTFTDVAPGTGPCAGTKGPNSANYTNWFGFDSLPVLNKNNAAVRTFIYAGNDAIATHWLRLGADGWRLDVMSDGSFPADFWQGFRAAVKSVKPDAPIIGELWKKSEVLPKVQGDQADSAMNYRFRNAILGFFGTVDNKGFPDDGQSNQPPSLFSQKLLSIREDNPDASYYTMMNLLDSHDTQRILWSLTPGANNRQDRELNAANLATGKQMLRMAATVQMTTPGAPTIYYGDEVGVTGDTDPDDRRTFPWTNGGTGAAPGTAPYYNAGGDHALLDYYRSLTALRRDHAVFRDGQLHFLLTDDANRTLAYLMRTPSDAALVAINRNTTPQTLHIDTAGMLPSAVHLSDALNTVSPMTASEGVVTVTLPAGSVAVLLPTAGQNLVAPSAPVGLSATPGNGAVHLTWSPSLGDVRYAVYRSPVSGGGYLRVGTTDSTSYTDTTVSNATLFYYAVTALDKDGNESGWSKEVDTVPSAPIGWAGHLWPPSLTITLNALQSQRVYAQVWVQGVTDSTGQGTGVTAQFAYGPAGSDPARWNWMPMTYNTDVGNNDEYRVDFTPETAGEYDYLARFSTDLGRTWTTAYTDDGKRGSLTVNPSSDTTPPAAPSGLHVAYSSPSSISLGWTANTEQDLYRYEVWRGDTSGGPYSKIANVPSGTTTYTDTTVSDGSTYFYVITAQDTSFNRSTNSNEVTAKAEARMVAVTFTATLPSYTPAADTIYIAGSFPSPYPTWDPAGIAMTRIDTTHARVTLNLPEGTQIEYKYTRGSWDTVEKGPACEEIANRQITISYGQNGTQAANDTVAKWRDLDHC